MVLDGWSVRSTHLNALFACFSDDAANIYSKIRYFSAIVRKILSVWNIFDFIRYVLSIFKM